MHITKFTVENYKSIRATPEIRLTRGFNVIVGQNNVGKTALVEALSLRAGSQPHRSLKTMPQRNAPLSTNSTVTIEIQLSRDELLDLLRRVGTLYVPTQHNNGSAAAAHFGDVIAKPISTIATTWTNGAVASSHLLEQPILAANRCATLRVGISGQVEPVQESLTGVSEDARFEGQVAKIIRDQRMYAFNAERLRVGLARFDTSTALRPDASNLPEVLANLQGSNPRRFDRLVNYLCTVFPTVKSVGVRPREAQQVEILIWTIDPQTEREDLTVSLTDSGTGIGQVLAMLYVALTAGFPEVILIDEPQSFLHPGAQRKLIEILKEHSQHQFIITTHSPAALTAADPETLLRLRIEENETVIDALDIREARDLRLVLADVGARLSDVFGADAILWVEGQTEEQCFPKVIEALTESPLLGTIILGVLHTADFDPRRAGATRELYSRLSTGRGLMPPAVGFIFDREGRSDRERTDLEQFGNVFFLQRRMYENYLLNPRAIAALASSIEGFRDTQLTEEEVTAWLQGQRKDPKYFAPFTVGRGDAAWMTNVNGAKLLSDLFTHFSETRVRYDKVRDGAALTEWLLENAPAELHEVAELISRALRVA